MNKTAFATLMMLTLSACSGSTTRPEVNHPAPDYVTAAGYAGITPQSEQAIALVQENARFGQVSTRNGFKISRSGIEGTHNIDIEADDGSAAIVIADYPNFGFNALTGTATPVASGGTASYAGDYRFNRYEGGRADGSGTFGLDIDLASGRGSLLGTGDLTLKSEDLSYQNGRLAGVIDIQGTGLSMTGNLDAITAGRDGNQFLGVFGGQSQDAIIAGSLFGSR